MAIVFIDLDGTLLYQGKPAPMAFEAIQLLKLNGHIPVIATGRVPYLVKEAKELLAFDSYICANGTYIVYQNQLVFEKPIPFDTVERLLQKADEIGFDIVMEGEDDYVAFRKDTPKVDEFSDHFRVPRPNIDKSYHLTHPILAFNMFDGSVVDLLRNEFPDLMFSRASHLGFDVNIKGDLKADGMFYLCEYLQIHGDEIYAIGDGFNDIQMISAASHGIAMGNAHADVKKVAKYVTTDVENGGVFQALKHFHLI